MKKLICISAVLCSLAFISCKPVHLNELSTDDYGRYYRYDEYNDYKDSPLSFNILKGHNPLADYDFKIITFKSYWFTYYSGDTYSFINKAFPNADLIMSYGENYYIGTKKEESK